MRERPIIFSAPMVRAILAGNKTQTRRVVKPQPSAGVRQSPFVRSGIEDGHGRELRSPYGRPGDRLWVRETWNICFHDDLAPGEQFGKTQDQCIRDNRGFGCACAHGVVYAATSPGEHPTLGKAVWRPSIHMPRWASRITLEITDVRVQRVQDISETDAVAEGLTGVTKDGRRTKYGVPDRDGLPGNDDDGWDWANWRMSPVDAFHWLWDSINAKRGFGWSVNPWVWALTFKREDER